MHSPIQFSFHSPNKQAKQTKPNQLHSTAIMSTTTAATMSQKSLIEVADDILADIIAANKATRIELDAHIIKVNAHIIKVNAHVIEVDAHVANVALIDAAMARACRKGMETRQSKRARLFL